jgi:hypothetical protein
MNRHHIALSKLYMYTLPVPHLASSHAIFDLFYFNLVSKCYVRRDGLTELAQVIRLGYNSV